MAAGYADLTLLEDIMELIEERIDALRPGDPVRPIVRRMVESAQRDLDRAFPPQRRPRHLRLVRNGGDA
jgi:hypothetical protein